MMRTLQRLLGACLLALPALAPADDNVSFSLSINSGGDRYGSRYYADDFYDDDRYDSYRPPMCDRVIWSERHGHYHCVEVYGQYDRYPPGYGLADVNLSVYGGDGFWEFGGDHWMWRPHYEFRTYPRYTTFFRRNPHFYAPPRHVYVYYDRHFPRRAGWWRNWDRHREWNGNRDWDPRPPRSNRQYWARERLEDRRERIEDRHERREDIQERREDIRERREDHRERVDDRRDERQDRIEDRREDRVEDRREERAEDRREERREERAEDRREERREDRPRRDRD